MGTIEFTGFVITSTNAFGAAVATPTARSRTMPALILNRSSLDDEERQFRRGSARAAPYRVICAEYLAHAGN
jgi:hypothetical protein